MRKIAITIFITSAVLYFRRWFIARRKGEQRETKCPLWNKCGGGIVHDYYVKQKYPYGEPVRNFIGTVCCSDNYPECEHYKIRKEGKVR